MNNVITIGPRLSNEQDRERQRMRMLADVLGGNQYGGPAGGLRSAGESFAKAYMYKQEQERMEKADAANNKALADMLKGGTAKPWVNPDTGQVSSAPAGGYEGMLAGLSKNPNSELARTLAPELVQARIAREQSLSDAEAARKRDQEIWDARFNTQRQARLEDMEQELMLKAKYGVGGQQDPAAVQEWKYYASLPEDQKAQYLTMKRANPWVDRGDAKVLTNPAQPGATMAEMPVGLPPERKVQDGQIITMPAMAGGQTPIPPGGPNNVQQAGGMPGTEQAGPAGVSTVALPPSPEAQAEKQQEAMTQGRKIVGQLDRLKNLRGTVEDLKGMAGSWFTGGNVGQALQGFAGSDQYAMNTKAKEIQALVGLDELIRAKEQGATFGSLTENEMSLLIAKAGTLDPLLETFPQDVEQVLKLYEKGLAGQIQDFTAAYPDAQAPWAGSEIVQTLGGGNVPQAPQTQPVSGAGGGGVVPDKREKYRQKYGIVTE